MSEFDSGGARPEVSRRAEDLRSHGRHGLETGHNADAVLMSLPPLAKWV